MCSLQVSPNKKSNFKPFSGGFFKAIRVGFYFNNSAKWMNFPVFSKWRQKHTACRHKSSISRAFKLRASGVKQQFRWTILSRIHELMSWTWSNLGRIWNNSYKELFSKFLGIHNWYWEFDWFPIVTPWINWVTNLRCSYGKRITVLRSFYLHCFASNRLQTIYQPFIFRCCDSVDVKRLFFQTAVLVAHRWLVEWATSTLLMEEILHS